MAACAFLLSASIRECADAGDLIQGRSNVSPSPWGLEQLGKLIKEFAMRRPFRAEGVGTPESLGGVREVVKTNSIREPQAALGEESCQTALFQQGFRDALHEQF